MNIVFWMLIVVALALLWFSMSFSFKAFGSLWLNLFNSAREEMKEKELKENDL